MPSYYTISNRIKSLKVSITQRALQFHTACAGRGRGDGGDKAKATEQPQLTVAVQEDLPSVSPLLKTNIESGIKKEEEEEEADKQTLR